MSKEDLIPFEKGQSGNPKGRPKGSRNRSTIAREMLELITKQKNPITGEETKELSHEQIMTLKQIAKAIEDGDTSAYKALMDSAYGAPKQEIDQTTIDKTPSKLSWKKSKK